MEYDRAELCVRCHERWQRNAADRAPDATEYFRLLELQSRLAGEVWESEAGAFWFETPPLYRPVEANDPMLRRRRRVP